MPNRKSLRSKAVPAYATTQILVAEPRFIAPSMSTVGPISITTFWSAGQVRQTAILLGLSLFLPFVFHLLPSYDDSAWGPRLLPLFYAPTTAALLYKPHVSLILAVAPLILNHLITGRPPVPMAFQLSLEMLVFTGFARFFALKQLPFWVIGPAAYILGKPVMILLLFLVSGLPGHGDPVGWALRSLLLAIPGVFILGLIGFFAGKTPKHGSPA